MAGFADQFEEIVACIALAVVVLAVSWGVITRYITAQPAAWASEVATLAFAWLVFFGAAACIKYRLHPTIDMLVRAPAAARCRVGVRWLNHALLLGFCAFMAWFGTRFAIDAWDNPSPVLRLAADLAVRAGRVLLRADGRCATCRCMRGRSWAIDARAGNPCGLTGSRRS